MQHISMSNSFAVLVVVAKGTSNNDDLFFVIPNLLVRDKGIDIEKQKLTVSCQIWISQLIRIKKRNFEVVKFRGSRTTV